MGELRLFGTEGFRIGFGADYLSELQKSLTISSSSGTVTVHDLEDGSTVTEPLGSDPRLLNRKVDIEWSMDGPGVQIPVSGSLGTGWGRVQTTFSLQAREGDFDLRFLNQREQGADDSLHGRGTFYGAEVGVATLCQDCPWFIESGFRFQKLAGADAERSPSFVSPGLRLMGDESRLSRETRDAFARFGYSFTGTNITTYTGVRHRWADVEVEDELRLFDPQFNQETTMRSRTKLDSSAAEAIVGVEARRGSFIGRAEVTFNDEDYGVLATVVYSGKPVPPPPPPPTVPPAVMLTLRLFWDLASLQIREPSVVPRLLSTNPREPERTLDSMEVGFAKYRKQLAEEAGIRPIVLFVAHGTDPIEEARRRHLAVAPWPPLAPPALLKGPKVDTLILFQREHGMTGVVPLEQTASMTRPAGFGFAQNAPPELDQGLSRIYRVIPDVWDPSKPLFHHQRCVSPDVRPSEVTFVVGLTSRKRTEFHSKSLAGLPREPCWSLSGKELDSIRLDQRRPRSPGGSVIIASSYFVVRRPPGLTFLTTVWIQVPED